MGFSYYSDGQLRLVEGDGYEIAREWVSVYWGGAVVQTGHRLNTACSWTDFWLDPFLEDIIDGEASIVGVGTLGGQVCVEVLDGSGSPVMDFNGIEPLLLGAGTANQVAVTPEGQIVVFSNNSSVVRLNADGSSDTSFGVYEASGARMALVEWGGVATGGLYDPTLHLAYGNAPLTGALEIYISRHVRTCDGEISTTFGYRSTYSRPVEIPVGGYANIVSESREREPWDRGQPTIFFPGDYPQALTLDWNGGILRYWIVSTPTGRASASAEEVAALPESLSCFPGCTDPGTAPSYAGGYEIFEDDDGFPVAAVRINGAMGLRQVEFYNTTNLVVDEPRYAFMDDWSVDIDNIVWYYDRSGDVFTFTRDLPDGVVFPIRTETSNRSVRFFARVTDWCGRTVDIDPSFEVTSTGGAEGVLAFALEASQPNPVRDRAEIRFTLEQAGEASLVLYDVLGREVAVLAGGQYEAGTHAALIDASGLPSGMYMYRLTASGRTLVRTLTVAR